MTPSDSSRPGKPIRIADLRGIARLATQATSEVTSISEGLHQAIWRTLGMPSGATKTQARGITGFVYRSIQRVTHAVGGGVDAVLAQLQPVLESPDAPGSEDGATRAALLAVMNGVIGDRLHADGSPFATPMNLRYRGGVLDAASLPTLARPTGKLLLFVHGLCMNDLQWRGAHRGAGSEHGEALASALGYTSVALRYNSGRHISENGRELAQQLEHWLAAWPAPVEELSIVAHSMGGLLARSAVQHAREQHMQWPQCLRHVVFLGTPHHGAPLERAGNWLDLMLARTPYTAPFAQLGRLRSAGITDLRHGFVRDSDWHGRDRFQRSPERREALPLPEGVRCHAVAATTAGAGSALSDRLVGDGLVPLRSALGEHDDPEHRLEFAAESRYIAYQTGHLELLRSPQVTAQLLHWLGAPR